MSSNKQSPGSVRLIFLILTVAVMAVIFFLSSQDAASSSSTSSGLTKLFIKLFFRDYDSCSPAEQKEIWSTASFIVRKLAHFSIYTSLGFFASLTAGKRRLFSKGSLCVVIFGFLYAFSDELHQMFSKGRSCEFRDMMIDTGGALTGMLISLVLMKMIAHFSGKKSD